MPCFESDTNTISSATVGEHVCSPYIQNPNPLTSSYSMSPLMNTGYISGELFPPIKDVLEQIQLTFFKYVFNLKKSTPSYMIYGELGIFPITIDMKY